MASSEFLDTDLVTVMKASGRTVLAISLGNYIPSRQK
jgi:hypothetical protein